MNRREARAGVEAIGFQPIALEHVGPPILNSLFLDHVHGASEDGMPVIRARETVDVDALAELIASFVMSQELIEFNLIEYGSRGRGGG